MSTLEQEISRRRNFAIISHPDAGKTTLTEKFLLYGGAIAQAGVVKGKKNSRAATSDWMEIEKQRGISVTSSVMQFQYGGFCINILLSNNLSYFTMLFPIFQVLNTGNDILNIFSTNPSAPKFFASDLL